MALAINVFFALLLIYYGFGYAFRKGMSVPHPYIKRKKIICNKDLSFMLFSVMTSMVFLGPLSLVKYGVWIVLLVMLSFKWVKKWDRVMTAYVIFILWNLFTLSYTHYVEQGWMMIIKFSLPILYFWMGYNAIKGELDFWIFIKRSVLYCVIYSFVIGGFSYKFIPVVYHFWCYTCSSLFISYASLADFYAILIGLPIIAYLFTKDKHYLYAAGILFLSTVLFSVRTGMGASFIGLSLMFLVYKKGKAIPVICVLLSVFLASIFLVPEVRNKMFGDDSEYVSLGNVQNAEIETSGREYMWDYIKERHYYPNPTFGSGCGNALGWLKEVNKDGGLVLIHSDWVQMMSESGNIGLTLYIIFGVFMLFKVLNITWKYKSDKLLTLYGGITAGAFVSCFFCMGFDNVITYAQQGYVLPFMLFGIFLKLIDLKRSGKLTNVVINYSSQINQQSLKQ